MNAEKRVSNTGSFGLVSFLFFMSGMSGLSYEVIWFKHFSHIWGSSTLAMASVVGAFLFGLGLGARLLGTLSVRVSSPLVCYGACEIAIGLLALLIPWEAELLWSVSIEHYAALREWPTLYALARCATTFVVIGPACVLMGGTLPLVAQHVSSNRRSDHATGWLYGINTLGAAFGCYVMGFHLLPEIGLSKSNVATAVLNVVIGSTVIYLAKRELATGESADASWGKPSGRSVLVRAFRFAARSPGVRPGDVVDPALAVAPLHSPPAVPPDASIDSSMSGRSLVARDVYFISAVTGCAALILQSVWNRELALVLGSSTYAFSSMLFVLLTGIGLGSVLFRHIVNKCADGATLVVVLLSGTVVATVAGVALLPVAAEFVGVTVPLRSNYLINAMVCIGASVVIELVPAISMGMLFPCLVHVSRATATSAGAIVGSLYAWNTAGTLVGAVATSAWLVPLWGAHVAIGIALIGYLGAASLVVTKTAIGRGEKSGLILALVAFCAFWSTTDDPVRTNLGMYLYGYNSTQQTRPDVLFFKEGGTSNVIVTKATDGTISFRVNGKVDGSSRGDMRMQLGLAYLPRFLNPQAHNILVVGFGTGTTSGASLLFPDTHVTCCEIEPAILGAAPHFSEINHNPQGSSRFTVVIDDARAFVQGTNQKYELILSEPSNPWIAGVANLFTVEFYRIASRKLTPNGIFAQWIQTYNFSPDDYALIVRTMRAVFPYQRLIRISSGDTILLGAGAPLDRDSQVVMASQQCVDASVDIQADLNRHFGTTDVATLLLTHLILDEAALTRLVAGNGVEEMNLDRDLQLEFRAGRHLYERSLGNVDDAILSTARSEWFREHHRRLECSSQSSGHLHEMCMLFLSANLSDTASALVDLGLSTDPDDVNLLVDRMILADAPPAPSIDALLSSSDSSVAAAAARLGAAYWKKKQYAEAVVVFERLRERFPSAANVWTNLAVNYALLGNREMAERAHRVAIELDPTNDFSRQQSEAFFKQPVNAEMIEARR